MVTVGTLVIHLSSHNIQVKITATQPRNKRNLEMDYSMESTQTMQAKHALILLHKQLQVLK